MRYLTVIAQETKDGIACAMHDYATLAEAQSAYHSELASGLISDTLVGDMSAVLNTNGMLYNIDHIDGKAAKAAE